MPRKLAIISLCLLAASAAFILSRPPRDAPASKRAQPPAPEFSRATRDLGPVAGPTRGRAAEGSTATVPDAPAGAIPGERALIFPTTNALRDFIREAQNAGLQVLDTNPALKAARIRIRSDDEAERARRLAGDAATEESNFAALLPLPAPPGSYDPGAPFEGRALGFLGVSEPNASWGDGVTIAVLDTGALPHPTLDAARVRSVDLVDPGGSAAALSPHGTAVASLIASADGVGVAPRAEILSIRVLDENGVGDAFTVAKGIVAAVDQGARVINMSLGVFGYSETLAEAVRYADERGVAIVAAAGNEGAAALPFPARFESVIAVSAVDAAGRHAGFANQGAAMDLAAPGVGVYAAWSDDGWASFTGTSAAAPYVAGSIAAVMSQTGLAAKDAAQRLIANANDTGAPGRDPQTGAGYIDLQRAMRGPSDRSLDLALSDIHLPPARDAIVITAQNRGTETIPAATLRYALEGEAPRAVHLGQLASGEVGSYALPIDPAALESAEGVAIEASVSAGPGAAADDKPENDAARAAFATPQ